MRTKPRRGTRSGPVTIPPAGPTGDVTRQERQAVAAIPPPDAFGTGVDPAAPAPSSVDDHLTDACTAGPLPSDRHTWGGSSPTWRLGDGSTIEVYAQGYDIPGATVLREVTDRIACSAYPAAPDSRERITVHRDVTVDGVSVPGGALYFCETATKSRCTGLLVRDDVVTRVVTVAGTLDRAEQVLRQAVPVAARRLAAAW